MYSNLIKSSDLFAQGIWLNINKSKTAKTIFGGILSIIIIILLSVMFYISIQDILYKTNPTIALETKILPEYPTLYLTNENIAISLVVTGTTSSAIVNPSMFDITIQRIFGNTSLYLEAETYNIANCTRNNFPLISEKLFNINGMSTYSCVTNQNFTLQGSWADEYISYLSINLNYCKNSSENNNFCAPKSEIDSFILTEGLYFNIYFINSFFNTQNYEKPITYQLMDLYRIIDPNSFKLFNMFIRQEVLQSDDGILLKNNNTINTLAIDSTNEDIGQIYDSFITIDIYSSNNKYINHRSYLKIQTVLASVGGLANILNILLTCLCYIFSIMKRNEIILNKIFEYDIKDFSDSNNQNNITQNIDKIVGKQNYLPQEILAFNKSMECFQKDSLFKNQKENVFLFFIILA